MGKIFLNGMNFIAYHGVLKEENIIGGKYVVDVELETDISIAGKSDDINDTVNYADVYQIIADEMKISSKLIEHVAIRIVDNLLDKLVSVKKVCLKLQKVKPPIKGELYSAAVEIERER